MFRYYDENWQPIDFDTCGMGAPPAAYSLNIHGVLDAPDGVGKASVSVSEAEGEVLFEIEVAWQEVFFHG